MNDFTGSLLDNLAIELPSWAFGNSGTRFKVFGTPGTPRTVREKIADAAVVHRLTGLAPTVALHIPWDAVDDYAALGAYAQELGVDLGTINSNTFQDDDYKFGSLTHTDKTVQSHRVADHRRDAAGAGPQGPAPEVGEPHLDHPLVVGPPLPLDQPVGLQAFDQRRQRSVVELERGHEFLDRGGTGAATARA